MCHYILKLVFQNTFMMGDSYYYYMHFMHTLTAADTNEVLQGIISRLCLCCWCPCSSSAAHWAVNCCFSRAEVTAVVTCNNACQDFASVPIPKISPPHVSWISHDPKRPTLNFGPRLSCVHSFLLFLLVMEPRLPFPPSHPNSLCNIILPLSSLSSSIWKCS